MHRQSLDIRSYELERVKPLLPAHSRVLEIGAGNGWQARGLAQAGHFVTAVDTDPPCADDSFHDVHPIDGHRLPFRSASFDVVFSSNVLEHASDLPALLGEIHRVVRHEGVVVHVLPSPAWRAWTIATRYPFLVLAASGRRQLSPASGLRVASGLPNDGSALEVAASLRRETGFAKLMLTILVEKPHGEFSSSLAELSAYRRARWSRVFREAGFCVEAVVSSGVFYTGYGVGPRVSMAARRRLARYFGSGCNIFVMRRC